ncbi:HAD family hydrolase [Paenalcaligenes niemegkensis]|uniref:D-glycero-alpha-D-manno-heptose-1,7-bisphosphate 7-phosphatase n=1 Tax=Paenalcaligenes niemegkensis TaxID=2895469 RepID=UPI001EE940E0|nr:HAD family hydrolase [Paenalcaligenes niemegkensis]MCQ9617216.1 HAD family hydrolase [Paenalcaligenes niemegkensis]
MALTPAIFLDKDGTVLQDIPYNVNPQRMIFAPGAQEGLAMLARLSLPLFIITNQPGIALGKFCFDEMHEMQQKLKQMFEEAGATLEGFYFCPHHPCGSLEQFAFECKCRKPEPGLLHEAAGQHHIDLSRSWFVGDILNDIEAGRRAGCQTILIDNGNETEWILNDQRTPHYRVTDLAEASRLLLAMCFHLDGVHQ